MLRSLFTKNEKPILLNEKPIHQKENPIHQSEPISTIKDYTIKNNTIKEKRAFLGRLGRLGRC
jgi:hypothetical protein